MKAKVTLNRGPLSHTHRNRKFMRGIPQILTSGSEIKYYQKEYGFTVKEVHEETGKAEAKAQKLIEKNSKPKKKRVYTKEQLSGKKKAKIISIAGALDIPLTGKEKKQAMIESILIAQELTGDDDEE